MTDQAAVRNDAHTKLNGVTIKTLKLWMKAFIPGQHEQTIPVPGDGEHSGKTMLMLLKRAFLTDQRDFSDDIHASARMHSELEIDLVRRKLVYEFQHCYETVEVDPKSGKEKCRKLGSTENMHFGEVEFWENGLGFSVALKASSKNPCISVATVKIMPNLDYEGTMRVALTEDRKSAAVSFDGLVESYPAFEMYASVNGSLPQTIFRVPIAEGATAADLMGPPNRPVSESVHVAVK